MPQALNQNVNDPFLSNFLDRISARIDAVDVENLLNVHQDPLFGDHRHNPTLASPLHGDRNKIKRAAVLIGIIPRVEGAQVILTRRTENLPSHPGQIAFPGGKVEKEDHDPRSTALRESEEEIGLNPSLVETLGYLPAYQTTSGYRIVPVLGIVDPGAVFQADASEVEEIFEVPLSFLMDEKNHDMGSRYWADRQRFFYEMPYGDYYIWGVTAGIIREMFELFYCDE